MVVIILIIKYRSTSHICHCSKTSTNGCVIITDRIIETVSHDTYVAIVGGGPVGLFIANLLGQENISTIIIERDSTICEYPRYQSCLAFL